MPPLLCKRLGKQWTLPPRFAEHPVLIFNIVTLLQSIAQKWRYGKALKKKSTRNDTRAAEIWAYNMVPDSAQTSLGCPAAFVMWQNTGTRMHAHSWRHSGAKFCNTAKHTGQANAAPCTCMALPLLQTWRPVSELQKCLHGVEGQSGVYKIPQSYLTTICYLDWKSEGSK